MDVGRKEVIDMRWVLKELKVVAKVVVKGKEKEIEYLLRVEEWKSVVDLIGELVLLGEEEV